MLIGFFTNCLLSCLQPHLGWNHLSSLLSIGSSGTIFFIVQASYQYIRICSYIASQHWLTDWFGQVAKSEYVIRLWCHHFYCPASSSLSTCIHCHLCTVLLVTWFKPYVAYILAYFPHQCASRNFNMCPIYGIWGKMCFGHIIDCIKSTWDIYVDIVVSYLHMKKLEHLAYIWYFRGYLLLAHIWHYHSR